MNFKMYLVCCFVVFAIVSVTSQKNEPSSELVDTPFLFGFIRNDSLDMYLRLKLPSHLSGGLLLIRSNITDNRSINKFEIEGDIIANQHEDFDLHVRRLLTSDRFVIDIQLYKHTGVCLQQRITEGREVKTSPNTSSSICLNGNNCHITLDLREECKDANVAESLTKMPVAPPAEDKAKIDNNATNHDIIIICLSVFATMVVVIVSLAFLRRYWNKRMAIPPAIQPPLPGDPFYVNLLYRKECQKEIDELENNIYEEIV